jgi:hypothetical protein
MTGAAGHPALPETPNPQDLLLIRKSDEGYGQWLDWGEAVTHPHQVLIAARELKCNPHTAAKRLIELGIRLPYTPEPWDEQIFEILDGNYWGDNVAYVLAVAHKTGRSPADVVARLETLGCGWQDKRLHVLPEADDLHILSVNIDGEAPYIGRLAMSHVMRAALALRRSPGEIADRLATLGYRLNDKAKLPVVADEQDVRLLETVNHSHQDEYHLQLEHILRSASLTGRSPADVASRLTAFGYQVPGDMDYPEVRGTQRW